MLAFRIWTPPDRAPPDGGWDDKGFGIVDHEWLEGICGPDYFILIALDEVEDVYCSLGIVCYLFGDPVPSNLDEFEPV